jgi:hypothetical protein
LPHHRNLSQLNIFKTMGKKDNSYGHTNVDKYRKQLGWFIQFPYFLLIIYFRSFKKVLPLNTCPVTQKRLVVPVPPLSHSMGGQDIEMSHDQSHQTQITWNVPCCSSRVPVVQIAWFHIHTPTLTPTSLPKVT